jgi:LAO/AO transport system kinase
MELADLVAVNKADGANFAAAERARAEAQNALHFFPSQQSEWTPRAIACSALTGAGIRELWESVLEYKTLTRANGWFAANRREQQRRWMHEIIGQSLRQQFNAHPAVRRSIAALERGIAEGRTTSFRAARMLLKAAASS